MHWINLKCTFFARKYKLITVKDCNISPTHTQTNKSLSYRIRPEMNSTCFHCINQTLIWAMLKFYCPYMKKNTVIILAHNEDEELEWNFGGGRYLACPTAVGNATSITPGNQPEIDNGNEICFKDFSELIYDEVSTERTQWFKVEWQVNFSIIVRSSIRRKNEQRYEKNGKKEWRNLDRRSHVYCLVWLRFWVTCVFIWLLNWAGCHYY